MRVTGIPFQMITENIIEKQRIIRSLYAKKSNAELSIMLGMSVGYIGVLAHRMGLRKDPDFLSATYRESGKKGLKVMKKGVFRDKI